MVDNRESRHLKDIERTFTLVGAVKNNNVNYLFLSGRHSLGSSLGDFGTLTSEGPDETWSGSKVWALRSRGGGMYLTLRSCFSLGFMDKSVGFSCSEFEGELPIVVVPPSMVFHGLRSALE